MTQTNWKVGDEVWFKGDPDCGYWPYQAKILEIEGNAALIQELNSTHEEWVLLTSLNAVDE